MNRYVFRLIDEYCDGRSCTVFISANPRHKISQRNLKSSRSSRIHYLLYPAGMVWVVTHRDAPATPDRRGRSTSPPFPSVPTCLRSGYLCLFLSLDDSRLHCLAKPRRMRETRLLMSTDRSWPEDYNDWSEAQYRHNIPYQWYNDGDSCKMPYRGISTPQPR